MKVIIAGCGKVGGAVARALCGDGVDLVVLDKREGVAKIQDEVDSLFLRGSCLSAKTLQMPELRGADLVVCAADSDETNILCGMMAKRLGVKRSVVRVRDPELLSDLPLLRKVLEIDVILNPEQQTAMEIARTLRFPGADEVETFAGGRVELVSFDVTADMALVGKPVAQTFARERRVTLAAVTRDGETVIPHGDFVPRVGDVARILGKPDDLSDLLRSAGINTGKIRNVVIVGGGRIAVYLAGYLQHSAAKVAIVEIDPERASELSEQLPRCEVICGDGTDEAVMAGVVAAQGAAVVCVTDRDEENVVTALTAKNNGAVKTVVKINRINTAVAANLGIHSIVSPKQIAAEQVLRYTRGIRNASGSSAIKTLYRIGEDAEAAEFDINESCPYLDVPVGEMKLKRGALIGCVVRGGEVIIVNGQTALKDGDGVIVFAKEGVARDFADIFK